MQHGSVSCAIRSTIVTWGYRWFVDLCMAEYYHHHHVRSRRFDSMKSQWLAMDNNNLLFANSSYRNIPRRRHIVKKFIGVVYNVWKCSKVPRRALWVGVVVLLLVVVIIVLAVVLSSDTRNKPQGLVPPNPEVPLPPSRSQHQQFKRAAVCTDAVVCSEVGRDILEQNGSAMDAAIAALFCNGVVNSQSMGLGGGFLMTVYINATREAHSLNAREAAPANATEEMYRVDPTLAQKGPLAVAVPGELMGYWEAHKRFGVLPWSSLIEPTIRICREGYIMTKHQDDSLQGKRQAIYKDPTLRKVFVNPDTNELYREGTLIKNTKLCDTLETISNEGSDFMYRGKIAQNLARDIQDMGGIVTETDFVNYNVKWEEPMQTTLHGGETVYTSPPPGSGALLALVLNIMDGYHLANTSLATINRTINTYHRITEAFKFAFARRGELGDTAFVSITELLKNLTSKSLARDIRRRINDEATSNDPQDYGAVKYNVDDHGTAHISVLAENGDAVAVTSSINLYFGAGFASPSTGIILNSGIDDFSLSKFENFFGLPPSDANRIAPGKRSMSSMTPTIVADKNGNVRLVVGASGGTKIFTASALVIMRHLWFGESIKQAVDSARFHHQLVPMEFSYEYGILQQVIDGLERLGHKTSRYRDRGSIICAIAKIADMIYANADFRKGGEVFGL